MEYSVSVKEMIDNFKLEVYYMPENGENIAITQNDVNRPGMQLTGFLKYCDVKRVQLIGRVENSYLSDLEPKERYDRLADLFQLEFPAMIISRGFKPFEEMIEAAKKYAIPVLGTDESTSAFMGSLIAWLNVNLAPRITRHGVLVEVYGEGILLLGDSGVGKSETAIELVKRGHRLIADDAIEIKKVSNISLIGTAPANIRHYIELRGIGVVDVRRLFGMGAVKVTEKIELVIQLEPWDNNKFYERLGMDNKTMSILDVEIPTLTIPVKPGRNLAMIIEVAAMNNRQKKMGYNAAQELNDKLMKQFEQDKFSF